MISIKPTSHSNPSFEWLRKQLEDESRPQRKQPPLPSLDDMTRLYVERMEICKEADNNIKRTIEMVSGACINPVQFILNTIRKYCPQFIDTLVKQLNAHHHKYQQRNAHHNYPLFNAHHKYQKEKKRLKEEVM